MPRSPSRREITTPVEDAIAGAPSAGKAVGTCDILNLVLGPLDLNVLGLEMHLDTVVLDIVAHPARRPAGSTCCARVANLLDGRRTRGVIGDLLNDLLDFSRTSWALGL